MLTGPRNDLTGQRFSRLVVLGLADRRGAKYYWRVRCDCGKETVVRGGHLPVTVSCGCAQIEAGRRVGLASRKPPGVSTRNDVLSKYKKNARNRGYEFRLTPEEFFAMIELDCHYCGAKADNPVRLKNRSYSLEWQIAGEIKCGGIDRQDNTKGYTIENCVPACAPCNYSKRDRPLSKWSGRYITK